MPATRSDSSEAFRGRLRRQRKSGSTHPKIGQPSAHLNYPATLNSFRSCLKVIDTFRELRDKDSQEVVFFISSLPVSVKRLAKHLRGHWGIENSLHWSLDVTFGEDKKPNPLRECSGDRRRLAATCSLDPQAGHFSKKVLDSRQETPGRMVQRCPRRDFDWKTRRLRCDSPGPFLLRLPIFYAVVNQ